MKKVPLSPVNLVLNKVLSNLGLDKRLREHTFLSLWPTFVNSAIEQRSRPIFIDADRNLVVSVADASTGQELSMMKGKVLQKVIATARSLNIDIRGLRLDLKHYHAVSTMPPIEEEKPLPKPTADALSAIQLTPEDMAAIADLGANLSADPAGDRHLTERLVHLFERELRIRRWRLLNGFPTCPYCGNPVERLHAAESAHMLNRSGAPMCITCLYAEQQP